MTHMCTNLLSLIPLLNGSGLLDYWCMRTVLARRPSCCDNDSYGASGSWIQARWTQVCHLNHGALAAPCAL